MTDAFFDWGKKAMLRVAKSMSPDDLRKKGEIAFESGKKIVFGNPSLRSNFVLLCTRRNVKLEVADRVFVDVMTKACNSRFGEMVRNFSEEEQLKARGKLTFRSELLAMAQRGGRSGGEGPAKRDEASREGGNSSAHAASTTATGESALPAYEPIAPGASARCNTFLRGKVFVIIGSFPKVHPD